MDKSRDFGPSMGTENTLVNSARTSMDGTLDDVQQMKRMGKEQVLRRSFNFLSIFGFAMIMMNTWQAILSQAVFGLANGGPGGLIYGYISVVICFTCVNTSMAELASMAPTAGGQYHWVSELGPRKYQKVLSFYMGWLCVLGWQCGVAIACYLAGTQLQGLIVLNYDDYEPHRWHGALLTIAFTLFMAIFNTFLAKHLPLVEGFVLCLNIGGFVAVLAPLWLLGPRSPSEDVWNSYANEGGWPSLTFACFVGLLTPSTAFLGADAAVHMSEELRDASKVLPRVMITASVFNGVLGFVMLVTFCYVLGDLEGALSSPTGYPYMEVFYSATRSKGGATAMASILTVSAFFNALTNMAAASRQLFGFARDKGIPYHTFFARVPGSWEIPLNAVLVTIVFSCACALVSIASVVAFDQLLSLGVCALLSSYFISIACIAWRRIKSMPLLDSHFRLGHLGLPLNLLSLVFLAIVTLFSFFPPNVDPDSAEMNYSCVAFGGTMILATVHYWLQGRHEYSGPVEYIRKSD